MTTTIDDERPLKNLSNTDHALLANFICRLELNTAWLDLQLLLFQGVVPFEAGPNGVWRCRFWRQGRGVERNIGVTAEKAVREAMRLAKEPEQGDAQMHANAAHVELASALVRNTLSVYCPTVQA